VSETTLSIIKPDGVGQKVVGKVLARLEAEGFRIAALKMLHLSKAQAEGFYAVHRERPFFGSLTDFMSEGPVVVMVLERENAIKGLREVMGATDPAKADEGTIRKEFAENVERNIIHGSDSPESAAFEISYYFNALEITST
jgi:nucleoside-diphosphate kinase